MADARTRRPLRRDAQLNRERVLTAAADVMAERGRHVPLAEIAAAAGVGVGTFYRGFPDRAALLQALEHRAYELLIGILDGIEAGGQTGAHAIEAYLLGCSELGNRLVLPLHGAPPLTDDAAVAARQRINASLERFLADGRRDGTVKADVNATDIIICAAMITQPLPNGPNWASLARRHIAVYMAGLRAEPAANLCSPAITRQDIENLFAATGNDIDQEGGL